MISGWPLSSRIVRTARPALTLFLLALSLSAKLCAQATEEAANSSSSSFPERWVDFYGQDWHPRPQLTEPAAPARRGLPSPLDSPPFPSSEWSYGGSTILGVPDTASYPLSSAIHLSKSRIKLYGWIEPSVNVSTSRRSNLPVTDDAYSNRLQLDRVVLIAERLPNTVQRDHIDWGFHVTNLFGTDYRFNIEQGMLSGQVIDHNRQYGYDTPFDFFDLYIPQVAQGMNLRIGRFATLPGIEIQIPTYNYMFSHSLVNVAAPVTDTGLMATIKLSDQWVMQLGLTGGHDTTVWSHGAKASGTACLSYTTLSVNDNFYACANGINSGKYAYNNVQQYDLTWYHKFSKTIHIATEAWYMYQLEVPSITGPIQPEANTYGAYCRPGQITCTAPEYAIVNYLNKQLSPHDFISLRSDFLNDKKGQRTGYQTRYSENTLSWTHWLGSTVQLRPELRYDHSWDATGYNDGASNGQFTAAIDVVFHY